MFVYELYSDLWSCFRKEWKRVLFLIKKTHSRTLFTFQSYLFTCTLRPPCRFSSQAWIFKFCTYICKIARNFLFVIYYYAFLHTQTMAVNYCKWIKRAFLTSFPFSGFFWLFLSLPTQAFLSFKNIYISVITLFNDLSWWSHCLECKKMGKGAT